MPYTLYTQVFRPHFRSDGYISDYCDGYLFQNHQLFGVKPNALQLILYFDELEVCNPLGSHCGIHKLGNTLYTCIHAHSNHPTI